GFGPIEFLLKDPEVTEVMVNGPDDVYVERKGRIERVQGGLFEVGEAVLHELLILLKRLVRYAIEQKSPVGFTTL
ncbi:MAG: CpaF family protein, partial [Actinomycetota bacterium]|nr:CpaF family protein [Actinomycetota bacterium]